MTDDIRKALELQREAEAAVEAAKKHTRAVMMSQYREVIDICRAAGVSLPAVEAPAKSTVRAEATRRAWAAKSPEERARWAASVGAKLREGIAKRKAQVQ